MKLRYQLFLISLVILVLPWSGWQYLKSVDKVFRDSQAQALLDNVKLIANKVSADIYLVDELMSLPLMADSNAASTLYAPPIRLNLIVDGYGDEWRDLDVPVYSFLDSDSGVAAKASLNVAAKDDAFYFYVQVSDDYIEYYNPSQSVDDQGDHLFLRIFDWDDSYKDYLLRTSAPSVISAHYYDEDGLLQQSSDIKGVWQEGHRSYQLEFVLGSQLIAHGFQLGIVNKHKVGQDTFLLNEGKSFLSTTSNRLESSLQEFASPGLTIKVVAPNYWLLALVEGNKEVAVPAKTPWVLEWFYRRLLDSNNFFIRKQNPYLSYEDYPEINRSLTDGRALSWYRLAGRVLNTQTLASAAAPIYDLGEVKAFVVLEKTTDQLVVQTTAAFGQLFLYTMGASLFVALALLLYATWLSFRIRRLHRLSSQVLDNRGAVNVDMEHWPDLKAPDELGDLSRAYRNLLIQIDGYHQYLRTLSGKLSHELRTPIAVVRSSLENMLQVESAEKREQYAARAQEGIQRLSRILSAMSAASSVEQSVADADFVKVDLHQLLGQLVQAYQSAYVHHSVVLESEEPSVLATISEELFVQMLDKLVDNASDFSPKGEQITIRLQQQKSFFVLEVDNTGALLPETMQGSIFDSMITLRESGESSDTHLGLGLYIVKLIVEGHKGEVKARNREDNTGVVFTLKLPIY